MKMADITSRTWTKLAEIPTDDFSIAGIGRAIDEEFGVDFYEDAFDVTVAILEGNIQICDDGIILWGSWKEV